MSDQRRQIIHALIIFFVSAAAVYVTLQWLTADSSTTTYTAPDRASYAPEESFPESGTHSLIPPEELSPAQLSARQALDDIPFEPGSIGDKVYNLLASGKSDFSRELYTFRHGFSPEASTLTDALKNELDQLAQVLRAYPELAIQLDLHTDDQGSRQDLRQLSADQGKALKDYLVSAGVQPEAISTEGFGPDVPLTANDTKAGRAQNRRVELSLRTRR